MRKMISKIEGNMKFLIIAVLLFLVCSILRPGIFLSTLMKFLQMTGETIPVLLLIFFLMFVFNIILDARKTAQYIGKKSGMSAMALSVVFGIFSAGPIYMWFPLLADLKEKGMKNSLITVFLYNRAVKLPLIPMMITYFGLEYTVILSAYMVVFSIINGLLIEKIFTPKI